MSAPSGAWFVHTAVILPSMLGAIGEQRQRVIAVHTPEERVRLLAHLCRSLEDEGQTLELFGGTGFWRERRFW